MTNWKEKMKEKKKEEMANLRSDSPTCRRIVLAILDFLDSVQPSAGVDFEGVAVSKDCLEHVFKINACAFSDEIQPGMLIDMFSSCARSSSPRVEDSSGLKNAASDLGQDPVAQPALSGNSSKSFNSLSSASLSTEFFPNKYPATTQPAGSTNHSAPLVSTPVDTASQSRTVASQRRHRCPLVGKSEEPSEPEIRIASSNTGLHHEQTWTTPSTGPSNPRISTRVIPVRTLIPPSLRSIYGTTLESTGQMNTSTQSTSSPSIPADDVNFFRTMYTASPSHQGHDSKPNGNREAFVGTLIPPSLRSIYRTALESAGQMNTSTQSTSSPSIPADVNFFRNMYTASPSHQGHDSRPNGNQEASGKMNSSTQSISSPSAIAADIANLFRIMSTTYQNHHGHESRPNGDQKVSEQMNSSMYTTSSPVSVPPDVVNGFGTMSTASLSHHGYQSRPNGNQEATGQRNSSMYTTSSPIAIPPDVVNLFETMCATPHSHHNDQSRPNGNQEASGQRSSSMYRQRSNSMYTTSSPIAVPPDVVNWFETMSATPHSHHGDQSRPNGNQEASGSDRT